MEARESTRCELAAQVLRGGGVLRLRVGGSSMLPALWPGDTVLVESARVESIRRGDIVLAIRNGRFFVHRVESRSRCGVLLTRGDCMPHNDPPVTPDQLLGKVTAIWRSEKLLTPGRFSWLGRLCGLLMAYSDSLRGLALRRHETRALQGL